MLDIYGCERMLSVLLNKIESTTRVEHSLMYDPHNQCNFVKLDGVLVRAAELSEVVAIKTTTRQAPSDEDELNNADLL